MIEVLKAIRTKALADATLVGATMLNGNHVYQEAPDIDTDTLTAWVILSNTGQVRDPEVPLADELYQFAVVARTAERADLIVEQIVSIFEWRHGVASGNLGAITGRRQAEPITFEPAPPPSSDGEGTGKVYFRFRVMRVATYAA